VGKENGAIELTTSGATDTPDEIIFDVKDKGVTTAKIADHAVGAAQLKSDKDYAGADAEVWVLNCNW
jgi:hypothetical protein